MVSQACLSGIGISLANFLRFLGGGAEVEFITRAVWSSQSEHVETQNAFEVGKQHLDLLALQT